MKSPPCVCIAAGRTPAFASVIAILSTLVCAQTVPPPTPAPASTGDTVTLSPFEVRSDRDEGYLAATSLAGTRLNTELWDTPAAISVFTKEFLDDTGVINIKEALEYAMNAESDYSDYTGQATAYNDINLRMRGFVGAQVGRNYFGWRLDSDRFNVERIDFSRGPNSVLFGLGAPGGIINTTTKRARIGEDVTRLTTRIGSFDDYRGEIDLGRTIAQGKLAARVNLLYQDRKGWREFEEQTRKSGALALTYRPFKNTEIRFDGEAGDVDQVIALPFPAHETFLGWINNGSIPGTLSAPNPTTGLRTIVNANTGAAAIPGTGNAGQGTRLIWDPYSGHAPVAWTSNLKSSNSGSPASPALADVRTSILDPNIQPLNAAITGRGFTGDFDYYNYALFVEQRVGDNLAFEAAFNRQEQARWNDRPQGFGQVNFKIDPNLYRPVRSEARGNVAVVTEWEPNPNFGKFFTESLSDHRVIVQDFRIDDFRLTGSYRLDLTERNKWFGRHDIAALGSRTVTYNWNDQFLMANVTPAGNAVYPLDVTANNNRIHRRTYIDFTQSDPRWHGMYDWKEYRLTGGPGHSGITEDFVRVGDTGRDERTMLDTKMAVLQSRWWEGRVVTTVGLRNDRQRSSRDTLIDPVTGGTITTATRTPAGEPRFNEWSRRSRTDRKEFAEGDTKTYGVVAHPLRWAALFYNRSDSFRPQADEDIFGNAIGNRKGVGEDYGVRFRLFDSRVHASLSRWRVDDQNSVIGTTFNFFNYINALWEVVGREEGIATPPEVLTTARDTKAVVGEGYEAEITANLTRNWRLSWSGSKTEQSSSDVLRRHGAYVQQNRARWEQYSDRFLLENVGNLNTDHTAGRALQEIDNIFVASSLSDGSSDRQIAKYKSSIFTTYAFRGRDSWIRGLTVGGGANYRGRAVVGYDTDNNNRPIWGPSYTLLNLMTSYSTKIFNRTTRFQVNIDNVLDENEPILTDADQFREYRYVFQRPRKWSVAMTVDF